MLIRRALDHDVPVIQKMATRFLNETPFALFASPSAAHLDLLIERLRRDGLLLVADHGGDAVGFLAAALYTHPMSGQTTASEIGWWMEPEHRGSSAGLRMLRLCETWAQQHGATAIQMIAPVVDARLPRLYRRLGYIPCETTYTRRLAA